MSSTLYVLLLYLAKFWKVLLTLLPLWFQHKTLYKKLLTILNDPVSDRKLSWHNRKRDMVILSGPPTQFEIKPLSVDCFIQVLENRKRILSEHLKLLSEILAQIWNREELWRETPTTSKQASLICRKALEQVGGSPPWKPSFMKGEFILIQQDRGDLWQKEHFRSTFHSRDKQSAHKGVKHYPLQSLN